MVATSSISIFQYGTGEQGAGLTQDSRRRLKQPRGISVAADGALLVADYGNHCVTKFAPGDAHGQVVAGQEGKILPTIDPLKDIDRPLNMPAEGEGHLMKRPIDVCANHQGGLLVLDTEVCRVQCFTSLEDKAVTVVPPPNAPPQRSVHAPEAIKYPRSVVLRPCGDVVICDTWSHRVLRYPADGSAPELLAGTPNSAGTAPNQLNFPSGIAFTEQGELYVTDTSNHRIQCFLPNSTSGTTIAGSAKGEAGAGRGELNMPTGICIDPQDGSILVADRCNARVLCFPPGGGKEGKEVVGAEQNLSRPWGVCQGEDGAVYVSDERKAFVLKVTSQQSASLAVGENMPSQEVTANASEDPMQLD